MSIGPFFKGTFQLRIPFIDHQSMHNQPWFSYFNRFGSTVKESLDEHEDIFSSVRSNLKSPPTQASGNSLDSGIGKCVLVKQCYNKK